MHLTVHQNCPSCGAFIDLHEDDVLIECPWCGVKNYRVNNGVVRFVLPDIAPGDIRREDIYYAPYLRFKGNVFYCRGKEIGYKIIDTTRQGMASDTIPASLGLRPQAMKVVLAGPEIAGRFFVQTVKASAVLARAAALVDLTSRKSEKNPYYHRVYIGDIISYMYLPLYIHDNGLFDAVTDTRLARVKNAEPLKKRSVLFRQKWSPAFMATICPQCGDTLDGRRNSLILSCHNCQTSWEEKGGIFKAIDWQLVDSSIHNTAYLPFWRIQVQGTQVPESFADLLKVANQPVVIRQVHEKKKLEFWIPAFKLRPKTFLHVAKHMTLSQLRLIEGQQKMKKHMHPVTLPRSEAIQALKIVLAAIVMNKRRFFPLLPGITFHPGRSSLVYLPFTDNGHDLIQEQTGVSLSAMVLQYGDSL